MRISVDAMGGDHGPGVILDGAAWAASEFGIQVTLVGNRRIIEEIGGSHLASELIDVHHCEEAVDMDESPLKAVRQKKEASIRKAFDLARTGEADAVVSAGNSGATLVAGVLTLGRIKGVERPGIASILPGRNGPVVLIDVGGSVDCRPAHLIQFGVMAQAFASSCLNIPSPRVGLLSIGEEVGKGNDQVRQAHPLFERSTLNFVGNVEGRDIFAGDVDIIVCDGFVGNVALKLSEGMASAMTRMLKGALNKTLLGRMGAMLAERNFKDFKKSLEYEEYGGAPLLGINGVGIVCHGGSSARAIKNAIALAASYVENGVLGKMVSQLNTVEVKKATA